jgi:hypothetical protein
MSYKNKKLPKTSQQISDEADRASSRAFAKHGLAPYDQDSEEPETTKISPLDYIDAKLSSNEELLGELKANSTERVLGSVVVDHEMVIPPEISRETKVIIGDNPLDEYHETKPEDSRLAS